MGVAHLMVFNDQNRDLMANYQNKGFIAETMNPKDENFIYF
jgi:hypothetical protein